MRSIASLLFLNDGRFRPGIIIPRLAPHGKKIPEEGRERPDLPYNNKMIIKYNLSGEQRSGIIFLVRWGTTFIRGIGAAGSALQWHCRGQGFEPPMLHHIFTQLLIQRLSDFLFTPLA